VLGRDNTEPLTATVPRLRAAAPSTRGNGVSPYLRRTSIDSCFANITLHCEQWNGANDFVFFAHRGELASNRREDHEVSMLALHLLQNCRIYVNTLMLQQVLAQPHWRQKLEPRDLSALTPLIWEHVNPYALFELDMNARIPLD
jgi:hypothetical protein